MDVAGILAQFRDPKTNAIIPFPLLNTPTLPTQIAVSVVGKAVIPPDMHILPIDETVRSLSPKTEKHIKHDFGTNVISRNFFFPIDTPLDGISNQILLFRRYIAYDEYSMNITLSSIGKKTTEDLQDLRDVNLAEGESEMNF